MIVEWGGRAAMAALVTPLTPAGAVDCARLVAHVTDLLARGLDGVVPFGTTGEGASVAAREKRKVVEALVTAGVPAERIVVGIAAPSVEEAAEAARHALGLGCAGILLTPAYYFPNPPAAGVLRWYSSVIERLGALARDVVAYNIPSVTGVTVTPGVVADLRRRFGPLIAAIKDSSGDPAVSEAFLALGNVPVMVGHEGYLAAMVRKGAVGSISGLANIVPERLAALVRTGAEDPAFAPAVDAVVALPVVPAVRAVLADAKRDALWSQPLPPLEPLTAAEAAGLVACWRALFGSGG